MIPKYYKIGISLVLISLVGISQPKRSDAIWARTVPTGSIIVDGKLNEPVWAKAESIYVQFGKSAGLPGSGFTAETGTVLDSTKAVVKFLVMGDSLYLAFTVKDSSIGGGNFGAADAIIFNIRNKSNLAQRPSPPGEFLWGWIKESFMNPGNVTAVGGAPVTGPFEKHYAITDFETATTVQGITNSDVFPDTSYTVEMKIDLKKLGYKVSDASGDIVMFNVAIRDCDWFWPVQDWVTFSRTWIQGPWGNNFEKNCLRIHVRSDVTTSSGTVPSIKPDYTIPNGKLMAAPTIDGQLNEAVWGKIPGFNLRFGDAKIRDAYPYIGPFASGQFQPTVNGGTAAVYDSSTANIKMFFKGNTLYVGIDVQDQVVQFTNIFDRWDGVMLTINGLGKDYQNQTDHDQLTKQLTVTVGKNGTDSLRDFFPNLRDSLKGAQVKLKLKPNTTVDTLGNDTDEGYQIEEAIDLTKMGYPAGLGDGVMYLGVTLFDGDSYLPTSLSYGTKTWWFRERDGVAAAAFVYMDSTLILTSVGNKNAKELPTEFELLGNYPNPFNPSTTIKFNLPFTGNVTLTVYDMLGRSVSNKEIGELNAGFNSFSYDASGLSTGVYFYQLRAHSTTLRRESSTPFSKILLIK